MVNSIADLAISLLFPTQCRLCARSVKSLADGTACSACWEATRIFTPEDHLCEKCGLLLGSTPSTFTSTCGRCSDLDFNKAVSIGEYDGALRTSVLHLKNEPVVPKRLREALSNAINRLAPSDLIIPVPLSSKRKLERGFNQSEIIADAVGKLTAFPIDRFSLVREVHTPIHRAGMDRKARELSVKKAFVVKRPKLVAGRRILLVDDVLTSGATASNCSHVLIGAGAASVSVFTLARAAPMS